MKLTLFNRRKHTKTIDLPARAVYAGSRYYNSLDAISFSCIDLIAGSFAGLSISVLQNGQKIDNQLSRMFNNPNLDDTKFNFFYRSVVDYYTKGNVFYFKVKQDGRLVSLFLLDPNAVQIRVNGIGQKEYQLEGKIYSSEEILHIPARFGFDNLSQKGKSIFEACPNAFSISNELTSYTDRVFENQGSGRVIVDASEYFPKGSNVGMDEKVDYFASNLQRLFFGKGNEGKPLISFGGLKYSQLPGIDNHSQQLIENRQFQMEEIMRLFGIPQELLASTGANIEAVYLNFIQRTIKPLTEIFEQSFQKMLMDEALYNLKVKFDYNNLVKTSLQTRIDCYTKQVNNGLLTVNEVRTMEGLEPLEAGNTTFIPANEMPLNTEVINAYMASAKLKTVEIQEIDAQGIGDDRK